MDISPIKYAVMIIGMILAAIATTGCTGPMGIVVGGESIHAQYNRRVEIEQGLERHTARDKRQLAAVIGGFK